MTPLLAWQPNSGQALKIVPGSIRLYSSADSPGIIYDLPNMTHFARVCCDMAKLYGCLFQTHGMVEGLRVAVRWNRRGLYRSRWGNYDLIPYPGLVAFSRGPAVADVLASRLQGRQVDDSTFFRVLHQELGFSEQAARLPIPEDLMGRLA